MIPTIPTTIPNIICPFVLIFSTLYFRILDTIILLCYNVITKRCCHSKRFTLVNSYYQKSNYYFGKWSGCFFDVNLFCLFCHHVWYSPLLLQYWSQSRWYRQSRQQYLTSSVPFVLIFHICITSGNTGSSQNVLILAKGEPLTVLAAPFFYVITFLNFLQLINVKYILLLFSHINIFCLY